MSEHFGGFEAESQLTRNEGLIRIIESLSSCGDAVRFMGVMTVASTMPFDARIHVDFTWAVELATATAGPDWADVHLVNDQRRAEAWSVNYFKTASWLSSHWHNLADDDRDECLVLAAERVSKAYRPVEMGTTTSMDEILDSLPTSESFGAWKTIANFRALTIWRQRAEEPLFVPITTGAAGEDEVERHFRDDGTGDSVAESGVETVAWLAAHDLVSQHERRQCRRPLAFRTVQRIVEACAASENARLFYAEGRRLTVFMTLRVEDPDGWGCIPTDGMDLPTRDDLRRVDGLAAESFYKNIHCDSNARLGLVGRVQAAITAATLKDAATFEQLLGF